MNKIAHQKSLRLYLIGTVTAHKRPQLAACALPALIKELRCP